MHAQDLFVYQGRNGQAVEAVSERLPNPNVVSPLAFVIESINSVDRGALMVASQQEEIFRVLNLVGQ